MEKSLIPEGLKELSSLVKDGWPTGAAVVTWAESMVALRIVEGGSFAIVVIEAMVGLGESVRSMTSGGESVRSIGDCNDLPEP